MNTHPSHPLSIDALLGHADWLRHFATALVLDPARADDVVQQTWLEAMRSPPRDGSNPKGWLSTVARNIVRKDARSSQRRDRHEQAAARDEAIAATDAVVSKAMLHRQLVETLMGLEEPYRTALLLRYFEGLPPRKIAARIGKPLNTVRSHLARGLERLRATLDSRHQTREAWATLFLPLVRGMGEGALAAAHGSLLGTLGGGLMARKWAIGVAGWVVGGWVVSQLNAGPTVSLDGMSETGSTVPVESDSEEVAVAPKVEPERVTEVGGLEVLSDREPRAASTSGEPVTLTGRVIDIHGDPVSSVQLTWFDPRWPRLDDDGMVWEGNTGQAIAQWNEIAKGNPQVIDEIAREFSQYPAMYAALLRGEAPNYPSTATDPEGRWTIEADHGGGRVLVDDDRWLLVTEGLFEEGGGEPVLHLVLAPRVRVGGTVLDELGRPLEGAQVSAGATVESLPDFTLRLIGSRQYQSWSVRSEDDGTFELDLPVVEGVRFSVDKRGYRGQRFETPTADRLDYSIRLKKRSRPRSSPAPCSRREGLPRTRPRSFSGRTPSAPTSAAPSGWRSRTSLARRHWWPISLAASRLSSPGLVNAFTRIRTRDRASR